MAEEVYQPVEPGELKENHYVLVIHGTWNPPKVGDSCWYQLCDDDPDNFCSKLNAILETWLIKQQTSGIILVLQS